MRSLLLQAADECRRFGEFIERFSDQRNDLRKVR